MEYLWWITPLVTHRSYSTQGRYGQLITVVPDLRAVIVISSRASDDAPLRVSVIQRSAYLTAVTGYPAAAAAGEDLVTRRLEADAERVPTVGDAR